MTEFKRAPYVYQDPRTKGFVQVKLPKKVLARAQLATRNRFGSGYVVCFWHPEKGFYLEYLTRAWAKTAAVVTIPLAIVTFGLANAGQVITDLRRLLSERRYGAFTSRHVRPSSVGYAELLGAMRIANPSLLTDAQ